MAEQYQVDEKVLDAIREELAALEGERDRLRAEVASLRAQLAQAQWVPVERVQCACAPGCASYIAEDGPVENGVRPWYVCEAQHGVVIYLPEDVALYRRQPQPAAPGPDVREALADYAHRAWSGWMRYMWSKSEDASSADGSIIIPAALVERWTRQMNTPYADLPENEKASDRKEADEILAIVQRRPQAGAGGE